MRRRWVWALVVIAVPTLVWFVARPRPPIVWLGDVPPVDFVSPTIFGRKDATIDWKLPFAHIIYPKPRYLKSGMGAPYAICGLLEHDDRFSATLHTGFLRRGNFTHELPIFSEGLNGTNLEPNLTDWQGRPVSLGFTDVLPSDRRYIGLPYAVDEAHRDVDLQIDGKSYRLRLPVTSEFGSGAAHKVRSVHGDYLLEFSVGEWHYTIQTPDLTLSARAPKGTVIYVTDSVTGYLVPGNRSLRIRASFSFFYGKAVCLKEERARLRVTVAKGNREYRSLRGDLICRVPDGLMGKPVSAFAVWSQGQWIAAPTGMGLTNGPEPTRRRTAATRDGEVVDAYVYRRIDSWEIKTDLGFAAGARGILQFPIWSP